MSNNLLLLIQTTILIDRFPYRRRTHLGQCKIIESPGCQISFTNKEPIDQYNTVSTIRNYISRGVSRIFYRNNHGFWWISMIICCIFDCFIIRQQVADELVRPRRSQTSSGREKQADSFSFSTLCADCGNRIHERQRTSSMPNEYMR